MTQPPVSEAVTSTPSASASAEAPDAAPSSASASKETPDAAPPALPPRVAATAARGTLVGALVAGVAAASALNLLAARVYVALADRDGLADLDRPALRLAQRLRTPARDGVAAAIARLFGPVGMPILTAIAAGAVSRRPRRPAWFLLVALTGVGSLTITVRDKDVVDRARPPRREAIPPFETSPSFPSGHTLNATALSGVLAWLEARRRGAAHPLVAAYATSSTVGATVGASRILLGAHWLTDVAFAWLAGLGWLTVVVTADRFVAALWRNRRPRPARPVRATARAEHGATSAAAGPRPTMG